MKKRNVIAATLLLFFSVIAQSQEKIIVPKATALAYAKQTRCENGKPGKNYWQNSASYAIKATVDVKNKMLHGSERITYFNNSPDTLKTIVVRLYQDVFKKGKFAMSSMCRSRISPAIANGPKSWLCPQRKRIEKSRCRSRSPAL